MLTDAMSDLIVSELPFEPTDGQREAVRRLSDFVLSPRDRLFVLRGYAGTGKTSLVSAFVRAMVRLNRTVVLMAPTGRAAKVFSLYSGQPAYTIHKVIYRQKQFVGEDSEFTLNYNRLRHAVFVVDEASMIARGGSGLSVFGTRGLLDDLLQYVTDGEGCRLLFVGDTAQLPPVGEQESPALSPSCLAGYGFGLASADLTQVVRQGEASGVLWNATALRRLLASAAGDFLPRIRAKGFPDVRFLPGNELIDTLDEAYRRSGTEQTIVVTRSNKRAIVYNNGIRARIFDREGELTQGELIMVAKNNYYWPAQAALADKELRLPMDFIANGDVAEVRRIRHVHEQYGLRFADVLLRFPDYDGFELQARVLMDTLQSEAPALTREQSEYLFRAVLADYADIPQKRERMKRLREDPYYNALQIKYAYAVTCHKAQGGQWEQVFVDQGYMPEERFDESYLRWLYTAFTRTTGNVYLVNWPERQRLTD